ncbi:hypothetical protein R1sor_003649 [Riccia sorocarpa]|uniref:Uncharacterized protein n=1 Tax=Riccia sorocarpa TaxID=122646 RepID=A0ABD3H541_9MARC
MEEASASAEEDFNHLPTSTYCRSLLQSTVSKCAGKEVWPSYVKSQFSKDSKIIVACIAGGTLKPSPNLAEGSQSRLAFLSKLPDLHLVNALPADEYTLTVSFSRAVVCFASGSSSA